MSTTLFTFKEVTALCTLKLFPVLYRNIALIGILLKSDDLRIGNLILKLSVFDYFKAREISNFFILKPKTD